MTRRGRFIPSSPSCATLESRDTPSGGVWGSVSTFFDKLSNQIGITHHHATTNAAQGIQNLWDNSDKLSKPTHIHKVEHVAVKFK